MVVCPEGLNSELETLWFTFPELPLWNAAAPSKPQLIEVDLSSMQSESMTASTQTPTTTSGLPLSDQFCSAPMALPQPSTCISRGLWNSCRGLPPQPPPHLSAQYAQEKVLPPTRETEYPLGPEGTDSAIPGPTATLMQMSLWVATPGDTPSLLHVTHPML